MARSAEAEEHLIGQFRRHTAHRVYWAIVHGHPIEETIESNLVRDRGDGRRGSVNNPKIGKRAVTHVRPLEDLGDYSLVECQLETGRTNQIRIHLSERGHLVCGDVKYRQPYAARMIEDLSQAPRLALHAAELGFIHPQTGEDLCFRMPFPDDLSEFFERLRANSRQKTVRPPDVKIIFKFDRVLLNVIARLGKSLDDRNCGYSKSRASKRISILMRGPSRQSMIYR